MPFKNKSKNKNKNKNKNKMKSAYIIAIIISIVLYLLGIITGLVVQRSIERTTEKKIGEIERKIENIQLEYMYLSTTGSELNCKFLSVILDDTTKEMWSIRKELLPFEGMKEKNERVMNLERNYLLLATRAWILNSHVKQKCGENVSTVLFFYSVPCEECLREGYIFDELRDVFGDSMRVFVLDANIDEPIIQSLKRAYNIEKTPSMVVGNVTYAGFMEKEELEKIISDSLR